MDFTAQDLVYYLSAAAGAMSQDHMQHGIYLVYEEDGELIEKLWTGSEIKDQVLIAENVRTDTPALYLLNEDKASPDEAKGSPLRSRFLSPLLKLSSFFLAAGLLRRCTRFPQMP
jgi:hypothetical protein